MGLVHDFNKKLSLWFNAHGITNLEFVEGEEFCYYPSLHAVQWGMFESSCDNNFEQFFYEYGLRYDNIHVFFLSLMHEVGHAMTLHYFTDGERLIDMVAKEAEHESPSNVVSIDRNYWYWELPTEFAANMWAIEWMNTHIAEMFELHELCVKHLNLIFEDVDILRQLQDWQDDIKSGEEPYPLIIEEDD